MRCWPACAGACAINLYTQLSCQPRGMQGACDALLCMRGLSPACHGESTRYNRGTQLYPYTCKMSVHLPDPGPSRFLVRTTARHRIGQPVLLFANVQKLKPVKNNFIVYFSSICQYFSSGCAGDTGLYAPKMSVHLPDLRSSTFSGRATAWQRIGQPVLLFPNVQKKKKTVKMIL